MANDEVKTIRIVVDASKAVDGGRAAQRALDDIEKNTSQLSKAISGLENTFRNLFAGYLGMQGLRMLGQTADAFIQLQNSLRVTGLEAEQLRIIQDRLFLSANKNGVEVQALGQLFSRLSISQKELGASYEQMLRFVDGVTASLKVQGGSTESAKGALLQLAQAMGSGVVRAEEFNSILEGALPIAQAAAKGIDGMEGSVSKLRAAVVAGTVTSRQFFDGALKGFAETEKMAEGMALTTQAAFVILRNGFTHLVGSLTEASGGGGVLAKAIASVGREMDQLAQRPDIVRGIKEAFDAVSAAIDEALAKIQQFAGWLSKIIGEAGQFARSQTITDIRDSILPQWDKDISAQRTAVLKAERNVQLLGAGDRASGLSADSGQRYFAAQQEQFKAQERLAWMEQQRQGQVDRLARIEYEPTLNALRGNAGPQARGVPRSVTLLPDGGGAGGMAAVAAGAKEAKKEVDEVAKLIEKIERDAQRLRDSFIDGTDALKAQNEYAAAELRLIGEAPDVRARELAVLRATNDAKKAGIDLNSQEFKDRLAVVDAAEQLRIQQEELRRSQELWTEPLKQALRDIQSIGADAFDKLLESGKFSFEELQQTFMRIIRRMAAEFLALATIRPVMSVLVNAVSPSMAQSMGLGGGSSPMGGGGFLGGGGGGGLSMPSWLGGGSLSGWLNSPISFGGGLNTSASSPASMMAPTGASGAALGGITWGQGLGALAGAGMGVYQLAAGNGSASSTIGGISSILGAGLSLIPGIGPILGPAVGMLGNLLPGLFGMDKPPTITNQTYAQLQYGSNGWGTSGGAWGPSANSSQSEAGLKALGGGISNVFGLLGGVKDPSKVWGLSAQSKSVSGQGWSSDSTSTFLVDPSGNQQLWRMNESNMMDTASAQVAYRSILEGAVGDITENMRKALTQTGQTMGGTSLQAIAETVSEILTFDKAVDALGKTVLTAEDAIAKIDASFDAMYATADKYGLATNDVDAAKAKARLGYATDFGKGISREILEMTDPKAAAMQDIEDWRSMMVDNNKWLLDNVEGAMDQILKIEELFGLKRAAIIEQTTSNALGSLKNTLDRLLYGDLSGASPGDALSGAYGSYQADLAKANLGDAAAAGRLNSSSGDYMSAAASYYGTSSAAYQTLRRQTIIDVAGAYRYNGGSFGDIPGAYDVIMGGGGFTGLPGMGAGSLNIGLATVSQQFGDLSAKFVQVLDSSATRDEKIDELLDLMRRLVMGNAG